MPTTRDHIDSSTPMGATVIAGGVTFRAWAPAAEQMFVLTGDALAAAQQAGFVPSPGAAMFRLADATWGAFVAGLAENARYRFWVVGATSGLKRDPHARELSTDPPYPNCDCVVRVADAFPWHDGGFRAPEFRDLILYQLHVGVFYAVDAEGRDRRHSVGKFLDLLDRVDYLRDLGINALQLLPIQEFPSPTSRGYNGLDLYSPEMDYHVEDPAELDRYLLKANILLAARGQSPLTLGQLRPAPHQLQCVIDILHLSGIAVLFDVVFNHAGPGFNDQSLWFFDRQLHDGNPLSDNRSQYFTDHEWVGGRVFAYWKDEVREFLIANARHCVDEYHVDGIRYDEVSVMDDNGGSGFCRDLTDTMRYHRPQAIQIAEYWKDDRASAVRRPPSGLGFDAAWGDRLRDGIRGALEQAAGGRSAFVDLDRLAGACETPGGFDAAWRVVNCIENHDLVYADRDRRIAQLAEGEFGRARLATGLLLAARGVPMLFMGQEILEDKQWSDDVGFHSNLFIWWDGLKSEQTMRDHLQFCTDLIHLRRSQPALRSESLRVSKRNSNDRVFAIHRWVEGEGRDVLLVGNLQDLERVSYRVGFPAEGKWREILNSDFYDRRPGHTVAGNGGSILAGRTAWDGMPASAEIRLPANGFIVFSR